MARVTVEDVRLWTGLVAALVPAGGQIVTLSVEAVAGVIRAVKRLRGEKPDAEDPEATLIATEVVGMIQAAQAPWLRIRDRADGELRKLSS